MAMSESAKKHEKTPDGQARQEDTQASQFGVHRRPRKKQLLAFRRNPVNLAPKPNVVTSTKGQ